MGRVKYLLFLKYENCHFNELTVYLRMIVDVNEKDYLKTSNRKNNKVFMICPCSYPDKIECSNSKVPGEIVHLKYGVFDKLELEELCIDDVNNTLENNKIVNDKDNKKIENTLTVQCIKNIKDDLKTIVNDKNVQKWIKKYASYMFDKWVYYEYEKDYVDNWMYDDDGYLKQEILDDEYNYLRSEQYKIDEAEKEKLHNGNEICGGYKYYIFSVDEIDDVGRCVLKTNNIKQLLTNPL